MKILVKRGPQRWLLLWRPLKGRSFYPINYANVVFAGPIEQIRAKVNQLLQGQISEAEFEAFYSKTSKTLALWS